MDPRTESLDLSKLLAVCTDGENVDHTLLVQLLGMFLTDNAARLRELPGTVEAGDIPGVRRIAHAIGGSAAQAGALKVAELARSIERLAIDGAMAPPAAIEALAREFADVQATLRAMYPDVDNQS